MALFIVETAGRAIAAINAPSIDEARAHVETIGFRISIRIIGRDGAPIWDGKSPLQVRDADAKERAKWESPPGATALSCQFPID